MAEPADPKIVRLYRLIVEMERLDKPFDRTDFSGQATLLLGLSPTATKCQLPRANTPTP